MSAKKSTTKLPNMPSAEDTPPVTSVAASATPKEAATVATTATVSAPKVTAAKEATASKEVIVPKKRTASKKSTGSKQTVAAKDAIIIKQAAAVKEATTPNEATTPKEEASTSKSEASTAAAAAVIPKQPAGDAAKSKFKKPPIGTKSLEAQKKESREFMLDFNPETSTRERRKLDRKLALSEKSQKKPEPKGTSNPRSSKYKDCVYDENGIHIESGLDLCDCLKDGCIGCFFPCPKCSSSKCGSHCRVSRKFVYDSNEILSGDFKITLTNPYSKKKK